jgi:hypothetical protein
LRQFHAQRPVRLFNERLAARQIRLFNPDVAERRPPDKINKPNTTNTVDDNGD